MSLYWLIPLCRCVFQFNHQLPPGKVGVLKFDIAKSGISKIGIPEEGMPEEGIPQIGIPETGKALFEMQIWIPYYFEINVTFDTVEI